MIGSLGVPELLFILVLALLVFGPRKLPEIGRTLGRALGEFRRATSDLKRTLDVELSSEEDRRPTASPQIVPPPEQPAATPPESPEPSSPTDVAEPTSEADEAKAGQDAE